MIFTPCATGRRELSPRDISGWESLDEILLDADGWLRVLPAAQLRPLLDTPKLSWWCVRRGIYGLPTIEACARIAALADGWPLLEVGAGDGALGRGLREAGCDVVSTDSKCQRRLAIRALLQEQGQAPVRYHPGVVQLEAAAAVRAYRRPVVVASWLTPRYDARQPDPSLRGFAEGADYAGILREPFLRQFLLLGSLRIHGRQLASRGLVYDAVRGEDLCGRNDDAALFVLRGRAAEPAAARGSD